MDPRSATGYRAPSVEKSMVIFPSVLTMYLSP
jgi:hypothetical protein